MENTKTLIYNHDNLYSTPYNKRKPLAIFTNPSFDMVIQPSSKSINHCLGHMISSTLSDDHHSTRPNLHYTA